MEARPSSERKPFRTEEREGRPLPGTGWNRCRGTSQGRGGEGRPGRRAERRRRCAPRAAAARRRPRPEPRGAVWVPARPELPSPARRRGLRALAPNELNALERGSGRPGPWPRRREVSRFPRRPLRAHASMCSRIVICVPPAGAFCCLMRTGLGRACESPPAHEGGRRT